MLHPPGHILLAPGSEQPSRQNHLADYCLPISVTGHPSAGLMGMKEVAPMADMRLHMVPVACTQAPKLISLLPWLNVQFASNGALPQLVEETN